jgi:thioredoxin 1
MKKTISIFAILAMVVTLGCSLIKAVEHPANDIVVEFEKQISSGVVILDFFAQLCPPCKKFGPIFEKASTKAVNKNIKFIKIDIEQFVNLTNKYSVRLMPTIIALKDGKEVSRHVGGFSEPQFDKWLTSIK